MNGNQPQMLSQPKQSPWLWVAVAVVALLVLLFAVYYYYYGYVPLPEGTTGGAAANDVASLERDLNATPIEGLDAELGDIEKELQ